MTTDGRLSRWDGQTGREGCWVKASVLERMEKLPGPQWLVLYVCSVHGLSGPGSGSGSGYGNGMGVGVAVGGENKFPKPPRVNASEAGSELGEGGASVVAQRAWRGREVPTPTT
jgi:hypothetical protein